MNHSPYLEKPVRDFAEARRERIVTTVTPMIGQIRMNLEQAESLARLLSYELGGDAEDAASNLFDFLREEVTKDYLVPLETAVKEWLDSQEERDAPVGKAP